MKDMRVIITRAMLAFIAFIVIIIVYAFVDTSEGKIRKDEDRIVEYIKEKVELQNKEEIRKISSESTKKMFLQVLGDMM